MNQREIKFRAWDKADKIMYYGVERGIVFDDGSYYDFRRFCGHQELDDYHKWELMQYTGLKDKNGKEIYEGDIVCEWNGEKSVVEWSLDRCGEYGCVGWGGVGSGNYGGQKHDELEVIGNIYENPELLKP